MLYIISIIITVFFGFIILDKVKFKRYLGNILFGSWFVGSQINGFIFFCVNFCFYINFYTSICIYMIEFVFSVLYFRRRRGKFSFIYSYITDPWFYCYFFFTIGYSLKHLSKIYTISSDYISYPTAEVFNYELSFINSVIKGCNKRRKKLFFYQDPLESTEYFKGYSFPLLYLISLISLGSTYYYSSTICCFLNTISSAYYLYVFLSHYTDLPAHSSFFTLFNGSWATFFNIFLINREDPYNDFIHQLSIDRETSWYHPLNFLLSVEKSTSFSISIGLFCAALDEKNDDIIFYLSLIPNITFIISFLLIKRIKKMTVLIPLILKILPFNLNFRFLFKEVEASGQVYPYISMWIYVFGPFVFFIFLFRRHIKRCLHEYICTLLPTILFIYVIREGLTTFHSCAVIFVLLNPVIHAIIIDIIIFIHKMIRNEESRGVFLSFVLFMIWFSFYGSFINSLRLHSNTQVFNEEDHELSLMIEKNLSYTNSIYLNTDKLFTPITLSGHALTKKSRTIVLYDQLYDNETPCSERLLGTPRYTLCFVNK